MLIHKFDHETKEYLCSEEGFIDPLETKKMGHEVYLLPANSTFIAPLKAKDGFAVIWNGDTWEYVEDHRQKQDASGVPIEGTGTAYWMPNDTWYTPARYMKKLGQLPVGALLERPKKSFEELKIDKLSQIDVETSAAIFAGFDYTINNTKYHFSYDSFDQQNFVDTASMCQLALSGVKGLPTSVTWNSYLEDGTLVRQEFDANSFLELYTSGAIAHKATQMAIGGQRKAAVQLAKTKEELDNI